MTGIWGLQRARKGMTRMLRAEEAKGEDGIWAKIRRLEMAHKRCGRQIKALRQEPVAFDNFKETKGGKYHGK